MVPWVAAKKINVPLSGEQLSVSGTAPDPMQPSGPWLPAAVPGTVLSLLVDAGKVPDPNIGLGSRSIPDAGDGRAEYTYWWCCSFAASEGDAGASRAAEVFSWLMLDGVNYSAIVFLNGSAIPCPSHRDTAWHLGGSDTAPGRKRAGRASREGASDPPSARGMFIASALDVSQLLAPPGTANFLAVLVSPVDYPGVLPPPLPEPRNWKPETRKTKSDPHQPS
jgi:mannosylglycoprotein endo-beta-mannosidase